jgi:hypothetical protein
MFQPGRHFLGLSTLWVIGMLWLPPLSSAQVASQDPNFTPSVLKSGLSAPHGVVFRPPTGDLVLSQNGAAQVSLVNATSGATKNFATQSLANQIAVRSSDGVVAVTTGSAGSINFYTSNGALLGSIPTVAPCIGGLAFDAGGDLFVAGGLNFEGCQSNALYEFSGATPWTAEPPFSPVGSFNGSDDIEGLAFSAAPPPPFGSGTLYAVSSTTGTIYQVTCLDCGGDISFRPIATAPSSTLPWGIAIDPLSGDIYVSEFNGPSILRMPPPNNSCVVECVLPTPSPFATGFSDTFGLAFDPNGNLYVNETAGNLWKFTRNSFPTSQQPILQGQTLTFINPNPAMSDQTQTIFIPQSANLCDTNGHCAAFLQAIFVPAQKATLDPRLMQGSFGDSNFFGGGPVPPGTTCVAILSASPNPATPNCVNVIQKCYDANHRPFDICPVHEPSGNTDLIQLTFKWTDPSFVAGPNTAFLIDFDTAANTGTLTNITDMTDPGGGTRSLCSVTMTANLGAATSDFSLGPIPSPVTIGTPATVPVTSIGTFNSQVNLSVSDVPPGVTATLNQPSVTPSPAGSTDTSTTLTVTVGPSFGSANTPAGIATVIANLLASGCIDNSGIANALTSKLSAAQAAINGGQIQTAINTLGAFKSQVQAQSGNHISGSCTTTFTLLVTGTSSGVVHLASASVSATSTNAAGILFTDASNAITKLAGVNTPDPITGSVLNSSSGTKVTISNGATVVLTAFTDPTGFYYFANTGLVKGVIYTIQVTVPAGFNGVTPSSQIFTWGGKGLVFNFTLF